jgi:Tfp pilus assembly protein PilF
LKHFIFVASILTTGLFAADPAKPPVDERAIEREMDAVIEKTAAPSEKEAAEAHALLNRGTKAHDAGRYDDALEFYRKALVIDATYATAYYEMAFTLSQKGEQVKALVNVIRSIVLNPKSEDAYVLKGNVLDDLGFPDDAKAAYLALLEVQPASYMGHLNLGLCEARLGNARGAREELTKARDIDPKRPSSYFHLAKNAQGEGCDYEERDNLEKFLQVGASDARAGTVKARLKELNSSTISIDPEDPYSTLDMTEKLARTNWRSTTHRQRFPDACGYRLTFEEEKDILSGIVIPEWRRLKAQDPKVKQPYYDALLQIDDAGFIDEYIYDTKTSALGEPAKKWLADHQDRKLAFEAWAGKQGLLAEDQAPEESSNIPMDLITTMTNSKKVYTVGPGDRADSERFLAAEQKRFKAGLKLRGDDTVDCGKAGAVTSATLLASGIKTFYPVFRCQWPGDEAFDDAVKRASLLGLVARDLAPAIQGAVVAEADGIQIKLVDRAWLSYLNAKAAWRYEPELRKRYGGVETDAPSVAEEVFAFLAAAQGYRNSREPNDKGEAAPPDEGLDRLCAIEQAGHLRGFVLYEVIHRSYGISLKSLSPTDGKAVGNYLGAHVFVRASAGQS